MVHATGPSYVTEVGETQSECHERGDECLAETYSSAHTVACEKGAKSIGTCLISAGKSKGSKDIKEIVQLAVNAIVH